MNEARVCLNCTAEECDGNYPHCAGYCNADAVYQRTKLRKLGRGNATIFICLLVKFGLTRNEITAFCETTHNSVDKLIQLGLEKGYLTEEEADASRSKRSKHETKK